MNSNEKILSLFQIKFYLIDIFNETVYLIEIITVCLMAPCPPMVTDDMSVVLSWKSRFVCWRIIKNVCDHAIYKCIIKSLCYFDLYYSDVSPSITRLVGANKILTLHGEKSWDIRSRSFPVILYLANVVEQKHRFVIF